MTRFLLILFITCSFMVLLGHAQTNEWETDYVTFDNSNNGTGYQTSSVAAVGTDRFVALVTETPGADLFDPPGNYLVGYWDADSGSGLVPSPINGQQTTPSYGTTGQFTAWEYLLDQVTLKGAWQIAGSDDGYIYVANNDDNHNILVFELTANGVSPTMFRMETGSNNIYGVEVDTAGYVYVVDYEGDDVKTDEVKVYAGVNDPNTTWGTFGGHNDTPTATIDLPPGTYQGITVSPDGTQLFVSATSERSLWKYTGDPVNGYTQDAGFSFTLSPDDTIANGGSGTPSLLGLAFLPQVNMVCAAADSFIHIGASGGYPYARIYIIDAYWANAVDTIDVAEWNFAQAGSYQNAPNGRASGYGSICDVDVEPTEPAVYSQTYYGWAVDKWLFDGDLNVLGLEKVSEQVPAQIALKQNYPNPFNPTTTIEIDITAADQVRLDVYNILGQRIATLVNDKMTPGTYQITFDASNLPAGIYVYQLKTGDVVVSKKMTLTK